MGQLRFPHDVHQAMQGARVLHGRETVAFYPELRHSHEHGKKVMEKRRRIGTQEFFPDLNRRRKSETRAHVESWLGNDVGDLASVDLQGIAIAAERQRKGRIEPFADYIQLGIAVDAVAVSGKPGSTRIIAHDINSKNLLTRQLIGPSKTIKARRM